MEENKNMFETNENNSEEVSENTSSAEISENAEEKKAGETDENMGNIKIAVDVVTTIAGIAASEIEGVSNMYSSIAGGIAEILGAKKNPGKGVKVEMKEDSVIVDLFIIVEYGIRIPELAWEIQETVKENIETMTGLLVEKVNIHVEGISFDKDKEKKKNDVAELVNADGDDMEITD